MYHHQGPQPFSNGPRPPPNQQQTRPPSDMLSQVMGFQFPRPTQLPDELESALSIRGSRDMDHRLIEHIDRPNQHQNQASGSGISQHGSYSSNLPDNQPSQQPGVDWTNYQPPSKLFSNAPPSAGHQSHHGQQQPGTNISAWNAPISDSPAGQTRHSRGDGQGLYTPESAGSILASFGLSNEDLEVLSHYPDDQLTPDTLPFILRDIQINKSGKPKNAPSASSSSFSHSISDIQLPPSHSSPLARSSSPEVPSLLTVTQTAGKVIDYGHASRAKDDSSTRETFKREPLSSERIVKMYPSSSSAPKLETGERRQVRLEPTESSKHGDRDYRRTSSEHQRSSRSPAREFSTSSKSRHQDRDYRHERPKPRPVSETRSEESSLSRRPVSKPHSSSKKLPNPTMRNDFSALSPKMYPHTCSLCDVHCDQEKDWVDHINTVNHTAACRDLRNKYPDWKPNIASRSGRYGSRAADLKIHSPSRSPSWSPSPSPNKHKLGHDHRPHERTFAPHHYPRHHYKDYDHRFEHQHSGSRSPSHSYRTSSRDDERESSGSSRSGLKRPHYDSMRHSTHINQHPSSTKRARLVPKQFSKTFKTGAKGVIKTAKTAAGKDNDSSGKTQPVKKKKVVPRVTKPLSFIPCLVYLTGIPKDATEQEVTDLVGSFGKINNVVLLPCSEEENEKEEGQKASVCMIKAEDAQALTQAPDLSIRDQVITASIGKTPEPDNSSSANDSKPSSDQEKGPAGEDTGSRDTEQKTSDEKGLVLITGLPQDGWSKDDIIRLAEPFGTPSDIIMSRQNGKVLVYMTDVDTAEEMVKVHTFMPPKIKECDLNVMHIKQRITPKTPVALYNLLMGSLDPLESLGPVSWRSLIVIRNVPPSGSTEVQKLVRRFGTVIKTLDVNDMVICEIASDVMALSVCKRFQRFPCIIQSNPLFFSRKPDPKAQARVVTAFLKSANDTPANSKDELMKAAPVKEECEATEISEPLQEQGKDDHEEVKDDQEEVKAGQEEVKAGEDEVEIKKEGDELDKQPVDTDDKKEGDVETDENQEPAAKTEIQPSESVSPKENGAETPAIEETKPNSSDGEATSGEPVIPELPTVTQEMVKALIVECRTRTASQANRTTAPAAGEQQETQTETANTDEREKSAEKTKEAVKNHREEEIKRQEKDRKEREGRRERERREREKEEKAKKEKEREERARRERERREEGRREWERKERQRRGRKRPYEEGSSGSRWRHDAHRGRDEHWRDDRNKVEEEEEEQFDEFPFNMSDFVTVDEVGDVNDLPCSTSPTVPMETTGEEEEDKAPQPVQDITEDTPMEVATETTELNNTPSETEGQRSEGKVETSESLVSSDLPPDSASPPSQIPEPSHQQDATNTETNTETLTTTVDSKPEVKPTSVSAPPANVPAESPTNSTATGVSNAESEEEAVVLEKPEDKREGMEEDEDTEATTEAAETAKDETSEGSTNTGHKKTETTISKDSLPPFNPSNPIGMEFLVPKTGFLCKVCNRFFCGNKQVEMNHCKTLKHYENLQKFLQKTNS